MFFSSFQCLLIGSSLEDYITVWLDGAADPVAVSLSSYGPCNRKTPPTQMWTTGIQVRYPEAGPVPDTATYIQKLEREKEARDRGETKDNRSFLAKYVSLWFRKFFELYFPFPFPRCCIFFFPSCFSPFRFISVSKFM